MKNERVLIFSSREICYQSGSFFANQLGAAFEELGFDVQVCEVSAEDDNLDMKLEPLLCEEYRVAVDFNSMLPRMELEDGTRYLDRLRTPFFDYILDHPLFHATGLNSGVKNLHALVLDEAQEAYVRMYYPGVASVHTLPLAATRALYDGKKERECRILMPGTYDDPDKVFEIVRNSPEPIKGWMERLIERRIAEPVLPMEEAFRQELARMDMQMDKEKFVLSMNAMYAVDAYIRDYFRKNVLDELLKAGIPVTVIGEGWDGYHCADEHSLKRERALPFGLSFERIAKSHVLLNISPIFNRGMHDRIPAGMANRSVVLTDVNPYLAEKFNDNRDICFYSLERRESVVEQAEKLITDADLRTGIAEQAYHVYEEKHTWKNRAEQILRLSGGVTRYS